MKPWLMAVLSLLLFAACNEDKRPDDTVRSLYYWQTTFQLDAAERAFIRTHRVSRLYIRYFDVTPDDDMHPVPNATVTFADTLPRGVEVVPVVFIVNSSIHGNTETLADHILTRILQMNETHDIPPIREIQIDCDWTASTQQRYFDMLSRLCQRCHKRGLQLSATIRLHQLSLDAPPVDRGTLMMYNTGDVTRLDVRKPILDMRHVAPYLRALPHYSLQLNTAYPLFTWRVLFRGNKFIGIMHRDDHLPVLPGDSIAVRRPELSDIMAARRAIDSLCPQANSEVILYHLSTENIHRFTPNNYENIYQPH